MFIDLLFLILKCIIAFISSIVLILYIYFKYKHTYWKRKNVPGPEPSFPFGNIRGVLQKRHFTETYDEVYSEYKHFKYVGVYNLHAPVLIINDIELIKDILLRKHEYFNSHGFSQDFAINPLSNNLFIQDGEKWRQMRTKLSPIFTTNKLKMMFKIMLSLQKPLIEHLEKEVKKSNIFGVKEILHCYTIDVIAKCVYGIDCDSFKNPNNKFKTAAIEATEPSKLKEKVGLILNGIAPKLAELLCMTSQTPDIVKYFTETVLMNLKYREEKHFKPDDFLQYMIDLKKNDEENANILFTTDDIISQTFMFIGAGFDTSASSTSFCLLELAANPDVQEKLREEIRSVLKKYSGEMTYDALQEMNFLTMVIEETLRLHPPSTVLVRKCTKDYPIDENYTVEEGTMVFIPAGGVHKDPKFYPEPAKFDPYRFSPEDKVKREKFHYLTFGEGPRMCIGMRLGMIQVKVAIITILSHYKLNMTENTSTTKVGNGSLILSPELDELEFIPLKTK